MTKDDGRLTKEQAWLVEKNIELAHYLARIVWRRNPNGIDIEEAVSVAYTGLIKAARRWDPTRADIRPGDIENGKAFAGYARQRITGAIMDWQRSVDHVQRSYRAVYKALQAAGYRRGVSLEDAAVAASLDVDKARAVARAVETPAVSLEAATELFGVDPQSADDVESTALTTTIMNAVVATLQDLSPLQQTVVTLRYYSGLEPSAIAREIGVSPMMVKQAHAEAVLRIHEAMRHRVAE